MKNLERTVLTPAMRLRLSTNRHGRLTTDQWKDVIMEPLVTLLVLMIPGLVVLGPRLALFVAGGTWIMGFAVVLGLALMLVLRAMRYARAPLHFAVLSPEDTLRAPWMFWKPDVWRDENGVFLRFHKRLTPAVPLKRGQKYLVYYLKEANRNVLLSLAPADHDEAARWQPSDVFAARFARRGGD